MANNREAISAKQQEIIDFIRNSIVSKGYAPSVRDICDAVHLKSTSSVAAHLDTLEEKGYIRRASNKSRTIEILDDDMSPERIEISNIPVYGHVAAGAPIMTQDNFKEYFPIPVDYLPNSQCIFVTVKGDSMIDIGIYTGDYVLVEKCDTVANGDIALVKVTDSLTYDATYTIKRFYKEPDRIRLHPENEELEDMFFAPEECEIVGKVLSLYRKHIL
ncbi:MAG: transcriptional repressor LexA [Lachnospiraceae bacterium]|nr:transcriptional repressor LexA [Lachnospiraceae bacterium]